MSSIGKIKQMSLVMVQQARAEGFRVKAQDFVKASVSKRVHPHFMGGTVLLPSCQVTTLTTLSISEKDLNRSRFPRRSNIANEPIVREAMRLVAREVVVYGASHTGKATQNTVYQFFF